MKILIVLLVLAACKVSTPIGIYNGENSKLQTHLRDGQFFHTIGDWLGNLKNRIHETLFGETTTAPSLLSTEILSLDHFQIQQRLNTREWFLLDLKNLTFDPNRDFGFRIGNWYIIRKQYKDDNRFDNSFDELDFPSSESTVSSMDSTELNIEETFETVIDLMTTEILPTSTENETPSVTEETSIVITTQNTIPTSSVESSSLGTDNSVEDDKTTKEFTPKGSAEVLMG
ncbi:uncharacterized protein LOC105662243 isoform X1 [Megachile rotundata]|uniref:uncharacterized protein LOC105662243 isoform X1 n=1 Tax=Megachile rotundata TaxID=143995 RepID=UPI003FCF3D07